MGTVSAFMAGNYPHQSTAASLFVKLVNLTFLLEFKFGITKDISLAKMLDSFAVIELPSTICN